MSNIRQKALAQIHIAKKQLVLDDDTYRDMLAQVTGKRSARELAIVDLYKVIAHLKAKGFKTRKPSPASRHKPTGQKTQADKLRALWIDMANNGHLRDGSETALNHWVARMSQRYNQGCGIENVEWLKGWQASKLIEDLKQWQQRCEEQRP